VRKKKRIVVYASREERGERIQRGAIVTERGPHPKGRSSRRGESYHTGGKVDPGDSSETGDKLCLGWEKTGQICDFLRRDNGNVKGGST